LITIRNDSEIVVVTDFLKVSDSECFNGSKRIYDANNGDMRRDRAVDDLCAPAT